MHRRQQILWDKWSSVTQSIPSFLDSNLQFVAWIHPNHYQRRKIYSTKLQCPETGTPFTYHELTISRVWFDTKIRSSAFYPLYPRLRSHDRHSSSTLSSLFPPRRPPKSPLRSSQVLYHSECPLSWACPLSCATLFSPSLGNSLLRSLLRFIVSLFLRPSSSPWDSFLF